MKRGIFTTILLCVAGIATAQTPGKLSGFDANSNLANSDNSMFRSFDNRYEGVRGTPTVFDDFVLGTVNMKDGEVVTGQELNYDVVAKELIVRSRVYKKILAVRRDLVNTFELIDADGDTLYFTKVTDRGYFQKIYEGKNLSLYINHQKQLAKANYGGGYNPNARNYDEFVDVSEYQIIANGKPLENIKPSRKAFEKLFPEKTGVIAKYLKEHKVNFKDDKELEKFVADLDQNL